MNSRESNRIRIYRKGNGCVLVDPGLVILSSGQTFTIVNTTGETAVVGYDPVAFVPGVDEPIDRELAKKVGARLVVPNLTRISAAASRVFKAGNGPQYFEYEVLLVESGHCAEGNSKPGGLVDP
jgi:hypothetical protein